MDIHLGMGIFCILDAGLSRSQAFPALTPDAPAWPETWIFVPDYPKEPSGLTTPQGMLTNPCTCALKSSNVK